MSLECMSCGTWFKGAACACGWKPRSQQGMRVHPSLLPSLAELDRKQTNEARAWLVAQGITNDLIGKARVACCMDLCREIAARSKTPSKDWAHRLLDDAANGEILLPIQLRLAREAIGTQQEAA